MRYPTEKEYFSTSYSEETDNNVFIYNVESMLSTIDFHKILCTNIEGESISADSFVGLMTKIIDYHREKNGDNFEWIWVPSDYKSTEGRFIVLLK